MRYSVWWIYIFIPVTWHYFTHGWTQCSDSSSDRLFFVFVDIFIIAYWHILSGNMFELVAYCVANYCVSCSITMLCHLAFSSNILDDWYPARECYWPVLWPWWLWPEWPGWPCDGWPIYGIERQLGFLFGSSLTYGWSSGRGFIFLFSPHEWFQCLVVVHCE